MSGILKVSIYGVAVFFLLLLSSSCVSYEEVDVTGLKNLELEEFSGQQVTVSAEVEITNPNNYNITVTNSDFNISIDDHPLGNFKIDKILKLPKSSKKFHEVSFTMDVEEISPSIQNKLLQIALSGQEEIDIKVDGFIEAKAFMMQKRFPISYEDEVDLQL